MLLTPWTTTICRTRRTAWLSSCRLRHHHSIASHTCSAILDEIGIDIKGKVRLRVFGVLCAHTPAAARLTVQRAGRASGCDRRCRHGGTAAAHTGSQGALITLITWSDCPLRSRHITSTHITSCFGPSAWAVLCAGGVGALGGVVLPCTRYKGHGDCGRVRVLRLKLGEHVGRQQWEAHVLYHFGNNLANRFANNNLNLLSHACKDAIERRTALTSPQCLTAARMSVSFSCDTR